MSAEWSTIYTYDGEPLRGLVKGEIFAIDAVRGERTMTSVYTGRTTSTSEFNDVAYRYNGMLFGMSREKASEIKSMLNRGQNVSIPARIDGFDQRFGYPLVVGDFSRIESFGKSMPPVKSTTSKQQAKPRKPKSKVITRIIIVFGVLFTISAIGNTNNGNTDAVPLAVVCAIGLFYWAYRRKG